MKKALLLALAGFFSAIAPAVAYPAPPANVNFSSERGVPFGLVLDGRPLTRGMARQVHVDRLAPGQHWADFTVPTAFGGAVRFRSRVWLEPGLETTFVLIARPGRSLELRQAGAVALYGPNRGRSYGGSYNSPVPYGQGPGNAAPYPDNSGYSNGNNGTYSNGNGGNNSNGGYNSAPNGGGYYPGSAVSNYRTMPAQEVDDLAAAMRQRPSEASRLSMAKDALNQSVIQADDLKELMKSLNVEASRVELAKFAYPRITDRQNFYRVFETLNSEASKQDIEQFINSAPQN